MKSNNSLNQTTARPASFKWSRFRLAGIVLAAVLIATGCSRGDEDGSQAVTQGFTDDSAGPDTHNSDDSLAHTDGDVEAAAGQPLRVTTGTLSDRIVDLGPANGIPEPPVEGPKPTRVSIDRIGVEAATVLGVGIEPNGEMEVPPPLEVGWYEYGPTPGDTGSAVLAGHIASNGIDGAFRYLDRVEVNDVVEVGYEDGSVARFQVTAVEQYEKYSLPFDNVFAEEGDPQLVLITCGGDFDSQARSYEDNVVVYAVPVGI